MNIRQMLVSSGKYSIKCPNEMTPKFITFHNTYNDASANNEVSYMINNNNQVSFHIAVDDREAVQGIPFNRNAWHCGDGNGAGNRQSIGVEICYSLSGGERYYKAEDNAAQVIAQLMKQFNIPIENVHPHKHWSGKYCPHRMLDEGRVGSFIERIKAAFNGQAGNTSENNAPSNSEGIGTAFIEGSNINLRSGAGKDFGVICKLQNGESYIVWAERDGWLNLGGEQWVFNDPSYIHFERKVSGDVGKLVVVTTDELWVYGSADWNDKEKTVKKGEAFTILEELYVNGSKMYRCKYFYITANLAYVTVK